MAAVPLTEFETELEDETAMGFAGESESEQFFGGLARLANQAIQSPALRRIALAGARSALTGGLRGLAGAIDSPAGDAAGEYEFEGEWEAELNPIRRVYPDMLMEHLGHAAAETESEAEAEAFIGALVPLAAQLLPKVAPMVMRNAPQLIRGVTRVARTLRRNPRTRPLVRTLPTVVRRTVADMARQANAGRPPTPRASVRTLARQTAQVLSSPRRSVVAYRRSRALDRDFHVCVRTRQPAHR